MTRYRTASLSRVVFCCWVWLSLLLITPAQPCRIARSLADQSNTARTPNVVLDILPEPCAIRPEERLKWFLSSTIGASGLVGGVFSAALGTALDSPSEYGPHWDGFAQRNGMRLTGVATSNAMEAALGAGFGEDPRYFARIQAPFKTRVQNVVDLTFRAYRSDGQRHWAAARYVAISGNNFLSNSWRAKSEADWQHALLRTAEGFGARALSNAWSEFMPEIWKKVRHQPTRQQ